MKTIRKVAWICIKGRKVLFTRSRGREAFYFPGGKPLEGEGDIACLQRELSEELSLRLVRASVVGLGTFSGPADAQTEPTELVCACYLADGEGDLRVAAEIEEVAWCTTADAQRLTPVGNVVMQYLKRRGLVD